MAGAQAGQDVACVSLDPARRLADVLDLPESTLVTSVPNVEPGRLLTWMPDSRTSVQALLDAWLPPDDPLRDNHLIRYSAMHCGMHELASLVHLPASVPRHQSPRRRYRSRRTCIGSIKRTGTNSRLFDGPFIKRLIQIFSVVESRVKRWFGAANASSTP